MNKFAVLALVLFPTFFIEGKEIELPESWSIETIKSACRSHIEREAGKRVSEALPVRYAVYKELGPDTGYLLTVELCYLKGRLNDGKWFISQLCQVSGSEQTRWFIRLQKYGTKKEEIKFAIREYENEPNVKEVEAFSDYSEKDFSGFLGHYQVTEQQNIW